MSLPKQNMEAGNRRTKNSQKVATLDEQNKVLQQVLEASKLTEGEVSQTTGDKEPAKEPGAGASGSNEGGHSQISRKGEKRRSENHNGGPPAKKDKKQVGEKVTQRGNDSEKRGLILEYPDYVSFPLTDSGEDQSGGGRKDVNPSDAGDVGTTHAGDRHEASKMSGRREHELSSDEEDYIEGEEQQLSGVEEDEDLAWDGRSIASSAIFPGVHGRTEQAFPTRARKNSARPEAAAGASSRSRASDQNMGDNGGSERENQGGSNPVEDLVRERVGAEGTKDSVGPAVETCIADLLRVFLKEPNVENVLKLVDDYPRPENAEWLQAPMMGKQVAASIPKRSNSYDKRLRQSQLCLGGSLAALSRVLQDIMLRGKSDPGLLPLARKVIDAMTMTGYVHADFNEIRKGAIRQVINPQYAGVFTRRTSATPDSLTGESSVPEQLKEQEELIKVRAKLQKPKKGNQEQRGDNNRGRGRGSFSGNFRGNSHNRGGNNGQGSGFGRPQNFQQRGRGTRPNYPQQRRVYGHQHQGGQDHQSGKDHNKM